MGRQTFSHVHRVGFREFGLVRKRKQRSYEGALKDNEGVGSRTKDWAKPFAKPPRSQLPFDPTLRLQSREASRCGTLAFRQVVQY